MCGFNIFCSGLYWTWSVDSTEYGDAGSDVCGNCPLNVSIPVGAGGGTRIFFFLELFGAATLLIESAGRDSYSPAFPFSPPLFNDFLLFPFKFLPARFAAASSIYGFSLLFPIVK